MAEKILKSITFAGSPDTYIIKNNNGDGGEATIKQVVVDVTQSDWIFDGKIYKKIITPIEINLPPSVTYNIQMQIFDFGSMLWQRVLMTPIINQEGNIIITSPKAYDCQIIITQGSILPDPQINTYAEILNNKNLFDKYKPSAATSEYTLSKTLLKVRVRICDTIAKKTIKDIYANLYSTNFNYIEDFFCIIDPKFLLTNLQLDKSTYFQSWKIKDWLPPIKQDVSTPQLLYWVKGSDRIYAATDSIGNESWDLPILIEYPFNENVTIEDFKKEGYTIIELEQENPVITMTINVKNAKNAILGVNYVGRENPLDLPRTFDAIGSTYSMKEVNSQKQYKSNFDELYPYNQIKEVSDSMGNKFIRIPKFYHRYFFKKDGTYEVQISGVKYDDTWLTCFINNGIEIDYMDIGKYLLSTDGKSISGKTIDQNHTLEELRTLISTYTPDYHLFDLWNYQVLKLLFLIEFATTDARSILKGTLVTKSGETTGIWDTVTTGSTDFNCVYRGIEFPWGNFATFVDGVDIQYGIIYVSDDIQNYKNILVNSTYFEIGKQYEYNGQIIQMEDSSNYNSNFHQFTYPSLTSSADQYKNKHYCARQTYSGAHGKLSIGAESLWTWFGHQNPTWYATTRLCRKPI